MKSKLFLAIAASVLLGACSSSKMAQNSPKESVDNDLYFTNVKVSEPITYASNNTNSSRTENNDGPLTRYYDPNDDEYYYSNRINKFYYPGGYSTYFDDYYNPYRPYTSFNYGMGYYDPFYSSSYYWNRPYYWGMPSNYFSMSFGFGWGYPSYGYGYGYSPYCYNNYLGYYYNTPWYGGGYYPGYYVYNVAPSRTYNNYGPRNASGGTNINRPRGTTRPGTDAYIPRGSGSSVGSTRPAWRPENTGGTNNSGNTARPRDRSNGSGSTETTRPTTTRPSYDGGSRGTESRPSYTPPPSRSGGESRGSGGNNGGSARPRSRN
ncbi:hypothetical protein [Solitalea canadensis]|uniref:Uncharacterized protein n=1 Tax=Solitalea canadensis (strain ATCC 29591 / DSM 3403 / JCM 21819 / LMG 8368 / NBRC 15130 / NCIMB 12057 / USAM 9D) TaxID=929556 RepID=H8KW43_SOLCM|nr:hypothetical protein [Solitalea canadensis]AFD07064.1 hypothetical protein Solca_2009 [Solitalea canadensis DSM 3403]